MERPTIELWDITRSNWKLKIFNEVTKMDSTRPQRHSFLTTGNIPNARSFSVYPYRQVELIPHISRYKKILQHTCRFMCAILQRMKILSVLLLFVPASLFGQDKTNFVDASIGASNSQGALSLSYVHLWKLGTSKKFGIGIGGRITSYLGTNQYYTTAPAELTSDSKGPGVIFKDDIPANIDSFLIQSPQANCLNVSVNFEYPVSKKMVAGFNIDLIGFSFGGSRGGTYINGANTTTVDASPTPFNLLLVSDNDKGSLNSELYIRYSLNERTALKLGAQFLFTEYTTTYKVQTFPSGNDRFRNKSLMLCLGVSRTF